MEYEILKSCRTCNKEGFAFCDINHDVIKKISSLIPNLINVNDENLKHLTKICTTCYQSIKSIVYNVENIIDVQKILKIENSIKPKVTSDSKKIVEHIARNYTNIKLKRISTNSTSNELQTKETSSSSQNERIIVVQPLPDDSKSDDDEPPKKQTYFMCITCGEKFKNFDDLQSHLQQSCSTTSKVLTCFCGKVLKSKGDLSAHVYTEHKQNKRQHVCPKCQKCFLSLEILECHMASSHTKHQYTNLKKYDKKFNDGLNKNRESSKNYKKESEL